MNDFSINSIYCPKCVNDNNGNYNPVCANCDDFCNFKEKENEDE